MSEFTTSTAHHWQFKNDDVYYFAGLTNRNKYTKKEDHISRDPIDKNSFYFQLRGWRGRELVLEFDEVGLTWDQYDHIVLTLQFRGAEDAGNRLLETLKEFVNESK